MVGQVRIKPDFTLVDQRGKPTAEGFRFLQAITQVISGGGTFQPLSAILTGVSAMGPGTGLVTQVGASTFNKRTLAASSPILIANPDGVAGNPTFTGDLASAAEAIAGVDATKIITSFTLSAALTAAGGSYQPLDADLTSWAGVTRGTGFDAFTATPSSANLLALLTDETGTGANVFGTAPTISDPALFSTTGILTITRVDTGTVGPTVEIFHDDATPTAVSVPGQLLFYGRDSAANKQLYGGIASVTTDVTSTTEDAELQLYTTINGVSTLLFKLTATGVLTPAGTAAIAPLSFTSGTNLTTAAAGAWEYDGKALYFSHVASSRGVVAVKQAAWATAVVALTNNITTAQSIFQAANDTLTVVANTSYRFRAKLGFNTGATSHTTAFTLGGTATYTSVGYISQATSSAAGALAAPQMCRVAVATVSILTAASTAVTTDIWIEGIIRTTNAGTIIPQVTFSAGPTGTCETAANSFFEIEPIGTDTVAAVGNWA